MATAEELQLPKVNLKRLIKRKLSTSENLAARDANISSEALLAFGESGKVFISYLTATANDICQEGKRQTISAEDVLAALEDLEFGELIPALRDSLEKFKKENRDKAAVAREKADQRRARAAAELAAAEQAAAEQAVTGQTAGAAAAAPADHDMADAA